MAKYRSGRINEEVKKAISSIIQNDIRDPRFNAMVSVTKVEVTNDLKYAKVYVTVLGDENVQKETMTLLKNSSSFIRKELSHMVKLRYTPEILLTLDTSIQYGMHIDALLEKIKETDKYDNEQNNK